MNDHDFVKAFETGVLEAFAHRDHVRLAWVYLTRDGWEGGLASIRKGIQQFAQAHGAIQKYHETITQFWARLVYYAIQGQPNFDTFAEFIQAYSHLLDKTLITKHYSDTLLKSSAAREGWVEPDLHPIPEFMM